MNDLEKRLKKIIDSELEKCETGLYPNLCKIRNSRVGIERVYRAVREIIIEKPMDIKSALAQYESSL
tara:strand:- start:5712 stop:5912 length:201 start_codon:yes stop_codon:yes gene_type:complete